MLLRPKCRAESNLGLYTTLGLEKRKRLRGADFRLKTCLAMKFVGSWHCTAAILLQVPKLYTDLDRTLFYISILRTNAKFVRKKYVLALGDCFPQTCSSAVRRFAAARSRLHYYRRIVSFPQQRIRWNAKLIFTEIQRLYNEHLMPS